MEHKRASKYEKGKIYKICSDDPAITDVYIGSTIQKLNKRMGGHVEKFKNKIIQYSSYKMFAQYGLDKFHIELIECYPCGSLQELFIREQHYLDTVECINERRAYTNQKALRKEHSEQKKCYDKERRKIRTICECGREVSFAHMSEHKTTGIHKYRMSTLALSLVQVQVQG